MSLIDLARAVWRNLAEATRRPVVAIVEGQGRSCLVDNSQRGRGAVDDTLGLLQAVRELARGVGRFSKRAAGGLLTVLTLVVCLQAYATSAQAQAYSYTGALRGVGFAGASYHTGAGAVVSSSVTNEDEVAYFAFTIPSGRAYSTAGLGFSSTDHFGGAPTITFSALSAEPPISAAGISQVRGGTTLASAALGSSSSSLALPASIVSQMNALSQSGGGVLYIGAYGAAGLDHVGTFSGITLNGNEVGAPTVTSITPTAGPLTGGTSVTITGAKLSGATAVTFGATAATSFTVTSATSITATAPAGSAGTVDIRVTTAGGTSATSAADQYTFVTAPTVTSISPTAGPTGGGTTVTITGSGFAAAPGTGAVRFGATVATYTINSNTQITATAPAGSAGTVDVTVTTVGGTSATSAADQFTYVAAPTVTNLSANKGSTLGSGTVTLTGTGFTDATDVSFGGATASFFVITDTNITVPYLPAHAAGLVNVVVTTPGGASAAAAGNEFTYVAPPTVTAVSPTAGPTTGGTSVVITGINLNGATAVRFGSTMASGFTVNSATQITATAPAGTGTVDIRVTTAGGPSATSAASKYTYIAAPTVISVSPGLGSTVGGTTVVITGTNFTGATAVTFGGVAAASFTVNSATSITATSPANTVGTVDIRVTTAGGTSDVGAGDRFIYFGPPTVTGLSTTSGPISGGTTVTLTGTNLSGVIVVRFGAAPATGFTVNSATQITAIAPANASGTVNVSVLGSGGFSAASAANQFTYVDPPTVTNLSADRGSTLGGGSVTLTGTGFTGATDVSFGGVSASFLVISDTNIAVHALPAHAAGLVNVVVTTPGGPSAAAAGNEFTYFAPPTVTAVSPSAGPTSGGTSVVITGTNLNGATEVRFDLTPALDFLVNSPTQITATAPAGMGTADIHITTAGGTSATSIAGQYTYVAAPTVANAGPVKTQFNTARTIDLSGAITGAYSSIAIATGPAHGTASISGASVLYTPTAGHVGGDSFTYTATGVGGTSAPATVSVTVDLAPQTITFSGISNTSLSASPVVLTATASSGLPVAYSSLTSAICTISGSTLTLLQTGICWFTISQGGDSTYSSAPPVIPRFLVTPAYLTVASGPASGTVVGGAFSQASTAAGGVAPYSYALTTGALPAGTTLNPSTGEVSGAPTTAGAFSYAVTATDSQPTPVSTTGAAVAGTIARGGQSVSFTSSAPAALVAGADYTPTAAATSGLAAVFSLDGTSTGCVLSGGVVSFTAPGTCHVNADQAGDANWNAAAQIQQSFVVSANPPTVADLSGVSVAYNSTGTAIDLSASITGAAHASIAIGTAPAHGTTSIAGDVVTYVPAAGYFGPDSFTYTATGPGGTSAVAAVSLTVATPAAPTVVDVSGVAVAYESAGTAIDLSASIAGVHASIAIATAPAHGTATISGDVITYTPAAAYFGPDNFTYTATGPGGTSAPATVSVIVAVPPAPTVANLTAAVAYASTGEAIALQPSGIYTQVQVATAPVHGSVTISGTTATYIPMATYFGPDRFTYTATGPGGTSAEATVIVMVATPPPPVVVQPVDPVVAPPSDGTPGPIQVDLGSRTEGVIEGYRIVTASRFGTAEIATGSAQVRAAAVSGALAAETFSLTYTPAPNFMGTDTVTLVAFGPGGDSAPVTFTFRVAGKAPNLQGQVVSNTSVTLAPTTGLVGGPFQALRITRAPAFGTATVDGLTIVFTPGVANGGSTSLEYVIDLPFGSSAAGRIDLVSNMIPGVQALTTQTLQGRPVTVRVSNAPGGPFTGATVVSVSPATAGSATVAGTGGTYDLTFTPAGTFSGQAVVTYSLTNAFGTSNGTLTVTVEARPDPSLDPEVRGVASSQVTAARRFADAQIDNFQQRLQSLHDGTNGSSNDVRLNVGLGGSDADRDPRTALRRQLGQTERLDPGALGDDRDRDLLGLDVWAGRSQADQPLAGPVDGRLTAAQTGPATQGASTVGFWTSGSIDWGRQDAEGQRDSRFATQGVTAGLDVRVSDQLILGGGLGYGQDKTRIGDNGSVSNGEAVTGALYASWRPADAFYIDGVLGIASLDFESRRWVDGLGGQPDGYADGDRSGEVRFASAAFGRVLRGQGFVSDVYARLEARDITLDGFTETGGGLSALIWDEIEQRSVSANLGASWRWSVESRRFGRVTPSARVEWSHELEDIGSQGVRYADWVSSPTYLVPLNAWSRNTINLDLGAEWSLTDRLMFSFGYRGALGDASTSHGAQIGVKYGW